MIDFIEKLPKAELHLHIEGTLEPELLFMLAKRNHISLPFKNVEALKEAYNFSCLQDFLDIYYEGANALIKKQDFFDLTYAYLTKISVQGVKHAEIFFDPETHTQRGIAFSTVIEGITEALELGRKEFGISSHLILCFLRHLDQSSAMKTLDEALPYKSKITAVGLDSSERGNPPSKFQDVFIKARKSGFKTVAHAGEEGPVEYIYEAIDKLKVDRIDHGNASKDDPLLMKLIQEKSLALTLCPLSNLKLQVVEDLSDYPIRKFQEAGIITTINSDDPAYFGGYINENYQALYRALNLTKSELAKLAKDSFKGSFLSNDEIQSRIYEIEQYESAFIKNE